MEPLKISKPFPNFSPKKLIRFNLLKPFKSSLTSPRSSPKSPATPSRFSIGSSSNGSTSREDEFRPVFRRFDSDNDGKISALELRSYFGSVGEYMSHEEAQAVINDFDLDDDGHLDFSDFMRLMQREEGGEEEDLKAAFEMFVYDKGLGSGSGRITPKSLQRVLSRLGDSKSYDECVAMIQVYDVDGNGELDYNEFQQMMMHGLIVD